MRRKHAGYIGHYGNSEAHGMNGRSLAAIDCHQVATWMCLNNGRPFAVFPQIGKECI
jgi:hypothetical protein